MSTPSAPIPWWAAAAVIVIAVSSLADLWARDWRLFVAALVLMAISGIVAVRRKRSAK